jgi:hypothetical protein
MSGELHAVDAETGTVQTLADQTHLGGSAGQSVNKQDTGTAAFEAELDILNH